MNRPLEFSAPLWLPGGNAQTIWSAICERPAAHPISWRRERWDTPDKDDFVDVDFAVSDDVAKTDAPRPLLVLFHGLEGSSASHYAQAFAQEATRRGMQLAVPHFRGCSGEINLAPRAYHSGDFEEIDWLIERFVAQQRSAHGKRPPVYAIGVSLGGNALMRWAGELGHSASRLVDGVVSMSAPLDLAAGGAAIDRGVNRHIYARMFLRTMVPKALEKLEQFPGLFDAERLHGVNTLYGFDDVFTAPLHGFKNTDDYWRRASAKPLLTQIRVPALVINARNDPFVPASSLPAAQDASPHVLLWQPQQGGHVGFARQRNNRSGTVRSVPQQVLDWLTNHSSSSAPASSMMRAE